MIRFEWTGLDRMADEMRRLATEVPDEELDRILAEQSAQSFALTHEHAGNLKASQRTESSYEPLDHEWTGTIGWTDRAAVHEIYTNQERDPGKGHDAFWTSLQDPLWHERYLDAITDWYADGA